ncbi:MAG: MFS transporter [Pseudomonadota bacterium]
MTIEHTSKLPVRTKLLFGSGQGLESGVSFATNTFLLYYLTNICKIPASTAGTLIFVSLLIDAIADPAIGSLSDRWRSRWGRRLPFMALGLPMLVVGAIGMFESQAVTGLALMAYVLAFNLLVRLGTSLFSMPYSAMTAELTPDYNERSSIAVYRCFFGFLGAIVIIGPAFGLIFAKADAMSSPQAYRELGWLMAGTAILFGGACIAGLFRGRHASQSQPGLSHQSPLGDLRDMLRNRSFLVLFLGSVVCASGAGSLNAINLYAYRYFWNLLPAQMQLMQLAIQIGFVAGIPVAAFALQRFEKHKALMVGLSVLAVFQGLSPLVVIMLPAAAPQLIITTLCGTSFVFGACLSLIFVAFQSMVADAIDEHQLMFGARCEGLYYSSLVFAGKAAIGIGSMVAGFLLTMIGLGRPDQVAVAALNPDAATWLGMIWGPGHALMFAATVPVLLAYKLDKRRHAQVHVRLSQAAHGVGIA